MTNADLFKATFGMYSTELWSMNEREFLNWMNTEVEGMDKSISCGHEKDHIARPGKKAEVISRQMAKYEIHHVRWLTDDAKFALEEILDGLPTVDAVPVARCRDCNEYQQNFHWCKLHDEEMQPNDFYSYGERREE